MIKIKKINHHIVKPIVVPKVEPDRIKGYDLINKLYCCIFICAKKESGKTNAIFKILKECTGKKTNLYIISSTVYNDDNWIMITDFFEKKGITIQTFTSIDDAKLDELIEELEEKAMKVLEAKKQPKPKILLNFNEPEDDRKKERKEKKIAPEYIFVFDDLSSQLRDKKISALIKKHRHFKNKVICSSQYPNDLAPEARNNIDIFILFGGHSEDKLLEIYNNCDLKIKFPLFMQLYENATSKPYSFLFVDKNKGEFRRNFNHLYSIDKFSE
jgi:hypothetical protein